MFARACVCLSFSYSGFTNVVFEGAGCSISRSVLTLACTCVTVEQTEMQYDAM